MKSIFKKAVAFALFLILNSFSAFAQDGFIGEIRMFAGSFPPKGWAFCEGQTIQIAQNSAMFSILGTTYGGDGRTTFNLPDLRGRAVIGAGQGPGLQNYTQGANGGSENSTLSSNNLPAQSVAVPAFSVNPSSSAQTFTPGNSSVLSVGNSPSSTLNSASGGRAQPINNMQPYTTIRYIICTHGIFPSRQ